MRGARAIDVRSYALGTTARVSTRVAALVSRHSWLLTAIREQNMFEIGTFCTGHTL
jgi:hypothetical protein